MKKLVLLLLVSFTAPCVAQVASRLSVTVETPKDTTLTHLITFDNRKTPVNKMNLMYVVRIDSLHLANFQITRALGYTPYNAANPAGYISSVPAQTWASITGKPSFATVATTGAYADLTGTPVVAARVFSTPTFSGSTTVAQVSSTRDSQVQYAYDGALNITLLAGQSVTAVLEYADNSGMSTNLVTLDQSATSASGILNLSQSNTLKVGGIIPAGKYRRVRFVTTGSGVVAPTVIKAGQEVLL